MVGAALQHPELAAQQLEDGLKKYGLRGAAIGGASTDLAGRLKGNGFLGNVIGYPLETTIALSHLIFEGTLDRFPGLKICGAHGGGFLPSYAGRLMVGTDYPFPWTKTMVDEVLATPGLSEQDRVAILGGTAAKLLGIKA